MALHITVSIALMFVSCLIIWRSAAGFGMASDFLGRKLTYGIKGATINAIASSMPEFLSSFFFLFYLKDVNGFSGGLGITAGSSIFNLLVIPALVILIVPVTSPGKAVEISRKVLFRDSIVLVFTILVLIIVIDQDRLRWYHGLVLVLVYILYIAHMFLSMRRIRKPLSPPPAVKRNFSDENVILKILKLRIEYLVPGKRELNNNSSWILLTISTIIMSFGTWLLVFGTKNLSEALNIPILFIAVILSAAASSVPDTVISVRDARKGNYDDAISNALGSNIFDISFALGLPLFLYTLIYGNIKMEQNVVELSAELWMFLLVTTFLGCLIFLSGKRMTGSRAYMFLVIYLIFLLYIIGQALHLPFMDRFSQTLFHFVDWLKSLF